MDKQIDEIQSLLKKYFRLYGYIQPPEVLELVANDLCENNVRKIPEDAVVLTPAERDEEMRLIREDVIQRMEATRKETAEKFAEKVIKRLINITDIRQIVDKIAKEITEGV